MSQDRLFAAVLAASVAALALAIIAGGLLEAALQSGSQAQVDFATWVSYAFAGMGITALTTGTIYRWRERAGTPATRPPLPTA